MIYKTLGTFIDDIFAFVITMPMLHRLATLRDDVIFFVYLYQYWKYKVDYSRVNEFGQGGAEDEKMEKADGDQTAKRSSSADAKPEGRTSGAQGASAEKREVRRR